MKKRGKISKFVSIFVILILCLSMSATVFAAEITNEQKIEAVSNDAVQPLAISGFNQTTGSSGYLYVSTTGYSLIGNMTVKFLNTTAQEGFIQVTKPDNTKFTFGGAGYASCTPGDHDNNKFIIYNAIEGPYTIYFWTNNGSSALVQCWIY